jgi:HK97 family phage major capsid protein
MPATDTIRRGRKRLSEIKSALDDITSGGFTSEEGGLVVSEKAATEFKTLLQESKSIQTTLGYLTEAEELASFLDAPASDSAGSRQGGSGLVVPGSQFKSLGQMFVESAEFKSREGYRMREDFAVEGDMGAYFAPTGGKFEGKDIYTAIGGTQTHYTFGSVDSSPLMPRPMRTQRVRDLFPVGNTAANLIQYVRVMGFAGGVNAARPVPERETISGNTNFGLKPHTSLAFTPAEAPVRTIAHYEVAHRNILDDEPQLRSVIDTELLYGLRLAEDDQLLNGDGLGENILGILQVPGIQQYPGSPLPTPDPRGAGDTYIDAIRRAATRVWLANYEATGIVVHPFDWERMELTKDANGNYVAAVNVQVGAEKRLWQLPVTSTPAMQEGKALVGAFGLGAKVYDRQQGNIRVSDQHADYFIRNAVVVLAEERVALVVPRPESFVEIDLPSSLKAA